MSDMAFQFDYEHEAERLSAENAVLRAELEVAESALLRKGYRKTCDIAACNCGSQWNHGGHAEQRLSEIGEALIGAGFNGGTLLGNIETVCAERDALKAEVVALRDAERLRAIASEAAEAATAHQKEVLRLRASNAQLVARLDEVCQLLASARAAIAAIQQERQ